MPKWFKALMLAAFLFMACVTLWRYVAKKSADEAAPTPEQVQQAAEKADKDCVFRQYEQLGRNLGSIGDFKSACGWMTNTELRDLYACTRMPDITHREASCAGLTRSNEDIAEWIIGVAPQFVVACEKDHGCRTWRHNYPRNGPEWWDLKPATRSD
ncbi:hypothetical protein HON52_01405 [Candidatus Uhrbacteria bacterium]|nr:hypothetical protein [Candidatus Uhrbacteria bacterium]